MEAARKLEDVYQIYKDDSSFVIGIRYLKSNGYIRKKKRLYYLNEESLKNSTKTQAKRTAKIFIMIFGLMILGLILIGIMN